MISWSDEAIEAAIQEFCDGKYGSTESDIRAALDAALAVQGCPKLPDCKTYADRAYAEGRAEALEEAARVAEQCHFDENDPRNDDRDRAYAQARRHAAKDIRALKETKGAS